MQPYIDFVAEERVEILVLPGAATFGVSFEIRVYNHRQNVILELSDDQASELIEKVSSCSNSLQADSIRRARAKKSAGV
jgi:hypothetical protein